jgi:UDP-N-acetylglucosamine--N-acetylmuramyl-(pentapeptide) pyrophosphoryl-undecaprenol N-acetylglucosamine transferase
MKILFTGGGTGGHFFPIIAVAEAVSALAVKEGFPEPQLFYVSDSPIDATLLLQTKLTYIEVAAGKRRTYASLQNFIDIFRTIGGFFSALWKLFTIYPDVIFSKGGYASFPILLSARLLFIPVVIHESDSVPGRVNAWSAHFAKYIAISYPDAVSAFAHKDRVAYTGQPIRKDLLQPVDVNVRENFNLPEGIPIILVLGGSQGAQALNDLIIDALPTLLDNAIVIHQAGDANLDWVRMRASGALDGHPNASWYLPYGFIDSQTLRAFGAAASIVVSRAGSTIFEIAMWGKPSILIPLPIAHGDHQRVNAYAYARTGAAVVLEQSNLKTSILLTTISTIINDPRREKEMSDAAREFFIPDAAEKIATALLSIASAHQ